MSRKEAWERTIDALAEVGIPQPRRRARSFAHQFSGGMAQRVMIAMMVAAAPELLIADEPTTGLDVTTEAKILDLLQDMREAQGSSMLLITHDLGVIAGHCNLVGVMHAGHLVEFGPVRRVFNQPAHPYTRALLSSVPRPDRAILEATTLVGHAPDPAALPAEGCRFIARCPQRMAHCHEPVPLVEVAPGHRALCHLYGETDE